MLIPTCLKKVRDKSRNSDILDETANALPTINTAIIKIIKYNCKIKINK